MSMVRKTSLSAVGCAVLLACSGANAQEQEQASAGGLLEEIVVTAQRREEKVQDVPIAISAFSSAQLEQLNIDEALGIVKLIPNLLGFNNTGLGTANGYYLRGIGNTESIATFDPPVGTYADDVFISRQNANNLGLFDVDRIEVLRGPQGTLFGRNTTGGAINVILKKPAEEFGGYMEVGFGQFNLFSARGSVDLPINDRVLTKFSAYSVQDDGYVSNPVTGENNLNAAESIGLRGALRLLLTDNLTWDLSAQYNEDQGANLLNFAFNGPQTEPTAPAAIASIAQRCAGIVTRSRFSCTTLTQSGTPLAGLLPGPKGNLNLGNDVTALLLTSNLQWDTAAGTVNFITGSFDLEQEFALDFFNGTPGTPKNPAGGFTIANLGNHRQFSQEIKLSGELNERTRYVAGVYYFREDNTTDYADLFTLSPALTLVLEDRILDNRATAWAAYTQWDLSLGDAWTLTLGGRYTDEEKQIGFRANLNPRLPNPIAGTRITSDSLLAVGIPLSQSTKLFTPRVALKYDFTDDVNVFASATRGFKSGGWNARGTTPVANQPFAPEKVWSYELGLRSEWFDRKLRFNLTAFQLDVQDLQTPSAFANPATGAISFITRNFADLDNSGVEVELIWQPIEDLTLFAFAGNQNAKYTNLNASIIQQQADCRNLGLRCSQGIVDPAGNIAEPVRVPDTLTLGGSYRFRLGESLTLTPNVSFARTGDNNVGTNGSPVSLVDAYDTWDAGVTLANADAGWQIQANCRNCSDEIQVVSTLSELPYIQDPRTWQINFKYNFGAR
jgi:iron complex outermembrane recepter protein